MYTANLYAVSAINARSRVISYDQFIENPLFLSGAIFVIDKRIVKKSKDIEAVVGVKLTDLLLNSTRRKPIPNMPTV